MIEVFLCNYLWASLAGFSSFALSFSITNQILYNNQNNIIQNYDSIHLENKNKFKNLVVNYENDKYKSNSVSFKKETLRTGVPTNRWFRDAHIKDIREAAPNTFMIYGLGQLSNQLLFQV